MQSVKLNLEDAIKELKSLPLFYFSLTSKELFHSNFLYWLSTLNINSWSNIFNINKLEQVKREVRGKKIEISDNKKYQPIADLVGYCKENSSLIIENKVKDIPHQTQLEYLTQTFGDNSKYVLLSFLPPLFKLPFNWEYITYQNLAIAIENKISDFAKGNNYYESLIRDYIKLINGLQVLFDSLPQSGDYNFTEHQNKQLYENLEEAKLWQVYQRISGSNFEIQMRNILLKHFPTLNTHFSITTQKACNDFYFKINNYNVGVQIEGNQFRRYLYGTNAYAIGDALINGDIWFNKTFKTKGKNKGRNFNCFDIKKENKHFIYQYEDVFKNKYDLTKQGISNEINKTLSEITSNLDIIEQLITLHG